MHKSSFQAIHINSLLGKLLYLHKCDKLARIFVNQILAIFRNSNSNSTFIALNLYLLTDSKTHKAKNQRS